MLTQTKTSSNSKQGAISYFTSTKKVGRHATTNASPDDKTQYTPIVINTSKLDVKKSVLSSLKRSSVLKTEEPSKLYDEIYLK